MRARVLVLGGTREASALAERLAARPDIDAVLSLAGRTKHPAAQAIRTRSGGFGGIDGLADYLAANEIARVVDATHPFAEQMSRHAAIACARATVPLLVFTRPPWVRAEGDRWSEVADAVAAAHALGDSPRRVFMTIGALSLPAFASAPQHHYLVRAIDMPAALPILQNAELILERPPFTRDGERGLMRRHRIDCLLTKNSGGPATYAKIEAARDLGLPVILIGRPQAGTAAVTFDIGEALAFAENAG